MPQEERPFGPPGAGCLPAFAQPPWSMPREPNRSSTGCATAPTATAPSRDQSTSTCQTAAAGSASAAPCCCTTLAGLFRPRPPFINSAGPLRRNGPSSTAPGPCLACPSHSILQEILKWDYWELYERVGQGGGLYDTLQPLPKTFASVHVRRGRAPAATGRPCRALVSCRIVGSAKLCLAGCGQRSQPCCGSSRAHGAEPGAASDRA